MCIRDSVSDLLNLVCRFMDEFQTKVMNAGLAPRIDVRTCLLRLRAEDRIPAANVSYYRMRPALWISQGDPMLFAWTAAIAIRGAGGKESAKDAMLGVEDGQMLIGDGFQPLRANGSGQCGNLRGVEIMRRGEARQALSLIHI